MANEIIKNMEMDKKSPLNIDVNVLEVAFFFFFLSLSVDPLINFMSIISTVNCVEPQMNVN